MTRKLGKRDFLAIERTVAPRDDLSRGATGGHNIAAEEFEAGIREVTRPSRVTRYADNAAADNTKRGYGFDWAAFIGWCEAEGLRALPADPDTVADYLSHLADIGRKASTIERAKAAIGKAHEVAGYASPTKHPKVKLEWQGILRTIGAAQTKKAPITAKTFEAAFESLPSTLTGIRDRALLMIGFAGAFRRSELVKLRVEDVRFVDEGLEIRIVKSKGDQTAEGHIIGIPLGRRKALCPVRLLRKWLDLSGITEGPLFRRITKEGRIGDKKLSVDTIARKVKEAARAAGLNEKDFSAHSLRAGLITAAAKDGKKWHTIMKQSRHESVETVKGYIRDATLFEDNAADGLY